MRISDWSSDVCSSDLAAAAGAGQRGRHLCQTYVLADQLCRQRFLPGAPEIIWPKLTGAEAHANGRLLRQRGGYCDNNAAGTLQGKGTRNSAPPSGRLAATIEPERKSTRLNSRH